MSASATIFISSSGSSAFLPVIAEMKNPKDYKKALLLCMTLVNASYLTFSLIVYKWCGTWVASPSLGVSSSAPMLVSLNKLHSDNEKT
jgi:amino acid transporter